MYRWDFWGQKAMFFGFGTFGRHRHSTERRTFQNVPPYLLAGVSRTCRNRKTQLFGPPNPTVTLRLAFFACRNSAAVFTCGCLPKVPQACRNHKNAAFGPPKSHRYIAISVFLRAGKVPPYLLAGVSRTCRSRTKRSFLGP